MDLSKEVLQNKRAEYVKTLQGLQDNVIALQGAIQAVDELIELTNSMSESELMEAIERGKQDAS